MAILRQKIFNGLRAVRLISCSNASQSVLRCLLYDLASSQHGCQAIRTIGSASSCQSFFNQSSFSSKTKEYTGRTLVGFSMEQIFEVVADVENYKQFVPFCKHSKIVGRKPGHIRAELSIGFPPINESYVSAVTLVRPTLVRAECTQGTLFDHLTTAWKMSPGLRNQPLTCVIDFHVSFRFRSALHSQIAHVFFNELVRQMEAAFFAEAKRRFGQPSIQTVKLEVPAHLKIR